MLETIEEYSYEKDPLTHDGIPTLNISQLNLLFPLLGSPTSSGGSFFARRRAPDPPLPASSASRLLHVIRKMYASHFSHTIERGTHLEVTPALIMSAAR